MKYSVKVDNRLYEVELGDLQARPVIATIGGEQFEVWPEQETEASAAGRGPAAANGADTAVSSAQGSGITAVRAPIPGTISDILVQPGQPVTVGQPLCVLDAMKMNNTIHSPRAGVITAVLVSVGQHVKHNDILLEFTA